MKRAALYMRVSSVDQNPEMQALDLWQFAVQRGLQIVQEYTDHGVSGTKTRRPALDKLMEDARHHRFEVVVVGSCDRLARSTKHLLQVLDELNDFGIQFLSQREAIDTEGALGESDHRHCFGNRETRKVFDRRAREIGHAASPPRRSPNRARTGGY